MRNVVQRLEIFGSTQTIVSAVRVRFDEMFWLIVSHRSKVQ